MSHLPLVDSVRIDVSDDDSLDELLGLEEVQLEIDQAATMGAQMGDDAANDHLLGS